MVRPEKRNPKRKNTKNENKGLDSLGLKAKEWYNGDRRIKGIDERLFSYIWLKSGGHEIFRIRILADIYRVEDYTIRHDYRNTLRYLKRRGLIIFEENKWITTMEGSIVILITFGFPLFEWRPSEILPEDRAAMSF